MNKCTYMSTSVLGVFSLFLVTTANAWTIDQPYDAQPNGEKCSGWGSSQSVVSSDKSASGGKSCKQKVTGGKHGFGEWGGIIQFPKNLSSGDEIWIRVRTYFPNGFNYDAQPRLKFLRVRTYTNDGDGVGHNDWYINKKGNSTPFSFIYEGRQDLAWNHAGKSSDAIKLGTWETYEFYMKFDTTSVDDGGKSRMRAWKNGILLEDMTDRVTLKAATNYAKALNVFTYWNNSSDPKGAPKSQNSYVDDLVITNERPSTTDDQGNPAIGMGGFIAAPAKSPPNPPGLN